MLVIALTGGIGSGKTTVSDRLGELGAGVIDTDLLSRELTLPGSQTLAKIRDCFGPSVLQPDGALDRTYLRQLIFEQPAARARLEAILHPAIKSLMLERLATLQTPYAVLVIPLLFETGQQDLADRVLVVDVPEQIQIERVQARSSLSESEARRIIASQIARETRLAGADDVIDNSGPPSALPAQIDRLHQRYLKLANGHP